MGTLFRRFLGNGKQMEHTEILKCHSIGRPAGFHLLVDETECFVPFEDYPRFEQAKLSEIFNMQRLTPDQFHWPDLDIHIELNALKAPEKFPLVWKDWKRPPIMPSEYIQKALNHAAYEILSAEGVYATAPQRCLAANI
jgi:hypothetical protein